jgi:hypothetical protein
MRNTVMYIRNLRLENAVFQRNLESTSTKFGTVIEEFKNTECILSQEFREM